MHITMHGAGGTAVDGAVMRMPASCWYATGEAALVTQTSTEMTFAWVIGPSLQQSIIVPTQCLTFIDDGRLVHASIAPDTTTTFLHVFLPPNQPLSGSFQAGVVVRYMIRPRAPDKVLLGPFRAVAPNIIRVQSDGPGFIPPTPGDSLLYLSESTGVWEKQIRIDDARNASLLIFGVQSVNQIHPSQKFDGQVMATIRSSADILYQLWVKPNNHTIIGSYVFKETGFLTSALVTWPFPLEYDGTLYTLLNATPSVSYTAPPIPNSVYFVRYSTLQTSLPANVTIEEGELGVTFDNTPSPKTLWRFSPTLKIWVKIDAYNSRQDLLIKIGSLETVAFYQDNVYFYSSLKVVATDIPVDISQETKFSDMAATIPTRQCFFLIIKNEAITWSVRPTELPVEYNISKWTSITKNLLVNNFNLTAPQIIQGVQFQWPFQTDITADVRVFHTDVYSAINEIFAPSEVVFSKKLLLYPQTIETSLIGWIPNNGDIVYEMAGYAASTARVATWDATTMNWSLAMDSLWRSNLLLVIDDSPFALWYPVKNNIYVKCPLVVREDLATSTTIFGNSNVPPNTTSQSLGGFITVRQLTGTNSVMPPQSPTNWKIFGRREVMMNDGIYDMTLSKNLPNPAMEIGYIEHWTSFISRVPFHYGNLWSQASFPVSQSNVVLKRRARVRLSEVLVPRRTVIPSVNAPITSLPYLWGFVRHPMIKPVGDQAVIVHRWLDPQREIAAHLRPPRWIDQRDTLQFLLTLPSSKIPGECQFIGLAGGNTIQVDVIGTVGAALPECCFVLPNGEILDFIQYESTAVVPIMAVHDEWAGVSAMLTVQFDEETPTAKRLRQQND